MSAVKADARALTEVLDRLAALVTPGSRCSVPDSVKEAIRPYVETWITPRVEAVRDDLAGTAPLPYYMRKGR